jgi:hypothetical protein
MTPINFLISSLNSLSERFSDAVIKLGYGDSKSEFLVDVNPVQFLTENQTFRNLANSILLDFFQEYEENSVVFIHSENITRLENVLYEWRGGSTNDLEGFNTIWTVADETYVAFASSFTFREVPIIQAQNIAVNFGAGSQQAIAIG